MCPWTCRVENAKNVSACDQMSFGRMAKDDKSGRGGSRTAPTSEPTAQPVILSHSEGPLQLTMHGQLAYIQVKKWHRGNPYHQRAAGEPERAKSLCRIAESTFPIFRNRRTPNSNEPAASAGLARARQNNSSPSVFRRAYSRRSAVGPPSARCPIKPSFTKCWKRRQRGQVRRRMARSPVMGGVSRRGDRRASLCGSDLGFSGENCSSKKGVTLA